VSKRVGNLHFQEAKVVADLSMFNLQLRQTDVERLKNRHIQCTDDNVKYRIHDWTAGRYGTCQQLYE